MTGKNLHFLGGVGAHTPLRNVDFYPPHIHEEIFDLAPMEMGVMP